MVPGGHRGREIPRPSEIGVAKYMVFQKRKKPTTHLFFKSSKKRGLKTLGMVSGGSFFLSGELIMRARWNKQKVVVGI